MGRRRQCENFAWRDKDPLVIAERANDRIVFRKINRELAKTPAGRQPSVVRLVRILSQNPLWAARLSGKTPESWKRTYNRWRQQIAERRARRVEKRDSVQAENDAFHPCVCGLKREPEKFYQETLIKYPPPRDGGAFKSASGEAAPRPPGGTEKEDEEEEGQGTRSRSRERSMSKV